MTVERYPLFLSIDVEPDQNLVVGRRDRTSWTGAPAIFGHVRALRGALEHATESAVRVGWYLRMDPQIEAICGSVDHVADRFEDSVELHDGDYVGLHVHATRWDPNGSHWVAEKRDADLWLRHLRIGLDAFVTRIGHPPLRHRFTAVPLTDAMLCTLIEAGVQVDLTPEPRPGLRILPNAPHRSGLQHTKTPPSLTIVPGSSTAQAPFAGSPLRKAARRLRRPHTRWYLNPYRLTRSPVEYWNEILRSLESLPNNQRYVALTFRTNAEGSWVDHRHRALLETLIEHPLSRTVRFADPIELALQHHDNVGG